MKKCEEAQQKMSGTHHESQRTKNNGDNAVN